MAAESGVQNGLNLRANAQLTLDRPSIEALGEAIGRAMINAGNEQASSTGDPFQIGFPPQRRSDNTTPSARSTSESRQQTPDMPEELLLDTRTVAKLLNVSDRTVWSYSNSGEMLRPIKIGSAVRWPRDEFVAWINAGCPTHDEWVKMRGEKGFG